MSEPTREVTPTAPPARLETFQDVLRGLVGKVVTCVNPESYEDAPVGHQLTTGFYKAKVLAVERDYFTLATEYKHRGTSAEKEPVKQFIPIGRIKRISLMKSERIIHL